ncbi:hypothetical protein CDL12_18283 [Handroanthus impetiginosus]|uniref:WLM domain-containing protein n=1 Tax=Handroanthus impetiginosus TaxID=429701 RepID=A0A2G9GV34_9LAMI|nr:hypothetical protein CDL12_18283 [Handroanthus impetiginosus]
MNKHRWRVGILTEMAPIGYVGVSPKCVLGFNKNHGEEISLRLRTDDLKGFRKYASIKKTLLHELAHMLFSEHDSNFYALDKQLNKEADALDWTKSRGHTLTGVTHSQHLEEEFDESSNATSSKKLGGEASILPNARAASVIAAFQRLSNTSAILSRSSEEPTAVPDSGVSGNGNLSEPDPDDSSGDESMVLEPYVESGGSQVDIKMNPHCIPGPLPASETVNHELYNSDNSGVNPTGPISIGEFQRKITVLEPEPDNSVEDPNHPRFQNTVQPDQMDFVTPKTIELPSDLNNAPHEHHPKDSCVEEMQTQVDSGIERSQTVEPDPDDSELQIIQDPVSMVCGRLQSAIQSLKYEVNSSETGKVLETLIKIIGNVIEHPYDMKFKKLRKANPLIQRNIIAYKAAMDILTLIGFVEDVIVDEWGKSEVFLMLKRNDPGLLWLAKSSLETNIS